VVVEELSDALEEAFGEQATEEFLAAPTDIEDDAAIARLVARSSSTQGREQLSALSALSAQMSAYRPLNPAEQAARLSTYRAGRAARAALADPDHPVKSRRVADLQAAVRRGEYAQTELVGGMYRLVLIISRELAAERYGREKALDMLSDLVGEANVAVVEAIDSFDEERCPTFSIYAGRVIRDRVRMSLQKSTAVGLAPSWLRLKRIYTVLYPEQVMRLGRNPTEEEMQAELLTVCRKWAADRLTPEQQELPEAERLDLMQSKLKKQGMIGAIDRLSEVLHATQQTASLDAPIRGDESGTHLGDLLPQAESGRQYEQVEAAELHRDLFAALAQLTERERQIMLYRFGFIDGDQWTYAKLAPIHGVSAERIRQIERTVIGKLKSPKFAGLAAHLPSYSGTPPDEDRRARSRGR
jgi:RNA polymerase sigma factor (sigma-70 family)